MIQQKLCQFCIRLRHIHPTKRHILLVSVGFCVSVVTLMTLQMHNYSLNHDSLNNVFVDTDNLIVKKGKDPFNTVIHQEISKWHHNDNVMQPKLLAEAGSKWNHYPMLKLFSWNGVPLHSVRAKGQLISKCPFGVFKSPKNLKKKKKS